MIDIADIEFYSDNLTQYNTIKANWDDYETITVYIGMAKTVKLVPTSVYEFLQELYDAIYDNNENIDWSNSANKTIYDEVVDYSCYCRIDTSLDPAIAVDTDNQYYVEYYDGGKFKIKTMNSTAYNTLKADTTKTILVEKVMQIVSGKRTYQTIS